MRWTTAIAFASALTVASTGDGSAQSAAGNALSTPPPSSPRSSQGRSGGSFKYSDSMQSFTNSPVKSFRELLVASPEERARLMEGKPEHHQRFLNSKLAEYDALTPEAREARLKSTELRWYLTPLMRRPPAERTAFVAAIPASERSIVENRLQLWDQLSPELQSEVLEHERLIGLVLRVEGTGGTSSSTNLQKMSPDYQRRAEADLARWQALPLEQRERMLKHFHQFFDLPEREKVATLGTLSEPERQQMEQTLERFQHMQPEQRRVCLKSFRKFTEMSSEEQERFLKNAALWEKMTPEERGTWRTLVTAMPPLPPGFPKAGLPPMPPLPAGLAVQKNLPVPTNSPAFTNK